MSFAIVTPSFNKAPYLRDSLRSVLTQKDVEIDYWALDNCSTDGSVEILRETEREYPNRFHALIEPDRGQADAINRGFGLAKGEIMAWLNADDIYLPDTLSKVDRFFREHPEIDLVYGRMRVVDENRKLILIHPAMPPDFATLKKVDFIPQPTSFWRRRVWDEVGPLDPSLHWAFDWDYYLRAFQKFQAGFLEEVLAEAVYGEDIKTRTGGVVRIREIQAVAMRYDGWMNVTNLYCGYRLMIDRLAQPLLRNQTAEPATRKLIEKIEKYSAGALRRLNIRMTT